MIWVPVGAWIGALVVAAVVLGFCAYEVTWKAARLRRDLATLQGLAEQATVLRGELQQAQERIAASGLR